MKAVILERYVRMAYEEIAPRIGDADIVLLNKCRMDEEAVAAALHSGQLGFYGADAFVTEPLPQESPLRAEPHAILTPHIAWTTREALQNLMDITTRNLRTWLEGNGEHIVNR